jgi:hypothetical protein
MNLTELRTWTIERGQDIDGAMLMGSFTRYLYRELDDPAIETNLSGRLDTGFDRLHGGCLFLSFATLSVLEDLIDWDRWGEEQGGVFAYEQLEAHDEKPYSDPDTTDLAAFLLREIPEDAWYQIAENWVVPTEAELKHLLTRWALLANMPLETGVVLDEADLQFLADCEAARAAKAPVLSAAPEPTRRCDSLPYDFEDFGLNLTELQDKYAAEQEHPEYTNQRWGVEAPTKPYWDWVMDHIAEDDEATE